MLARRWNSRKGDGMTVLIMMAMITLRMMRMMRILAVTVTI